jgi:diaminohydroxyphosphoribosylaminopyrimidine deaminase/5-amino-6-(5-phosphoribosylamino)uracil reductase
MASGESQWITGEAARQDVQRLRARSSAVVTGIGTILADDPSLNVRLAVAGLRGVEQPDYLRQPLRVILDSELRTPPAARLLRLPGDTLIVCGQGASGARERALRAAGAEIARRPQHDGRVQLADLMQLLAERAVNEVLIEAGPTLAGHALQAGLVDELIVYMAPHLMGQAARGLVALAGIERMVDRLQLTFDDIRHVGSDIRIRLRPNLEN